MTSIAVVGTGAMGSRIAHRLLQAGHPVTVWNRTPSRLAELLDAGAVEARTPAEAATRADVVITMVADPNALAEVTEASHGIAGAAHAGLTLVEMSTVGPGAVLRLAAALPPTTELVDAPVFGSLAEAEAGRLTILAGGREDVVARLRAVLSPLGSVRRVGGTGAGAAAKLVANCALFGTLATLGEVLLLGRRLGLEDSMLFDVLAATPLAEQAARRRPAIEGDEYPRRFALSLARKDAELVAAAAAAANVELRVGEGARRWLVDAESAGWGNHDYTAVLATILGRQPPKRASADTGYDGLIIDLDGVVWAGDLPIDGASSAIAQLLERGTRLVFLTNDPQSSRAEQASRLRALGIAATAGDVITSATATARFLAAHHPRAETLVLGPDALRTEIEQVGLRPVPLQQPHPARVVVVGGHSGFDYAELAAATTALRSGAALYATSRDAVVPGTHGPEPATGAMLAAIETAGASTATVIGKPERYIFDLARDVLEGCRDVAVVGDNLSSDIAGARRAGVDAILVLTGVTSERDLAGSAIQPDLVLPSLAALPAQLE